MKIHKFRFFGSFFIFQVSPVCWIPSIWTPLLIQNFSASFGSRSLLKNMIVQKLSDTHSVCVQRSAFGNVQCSGCSALFCKYNFHAFTFQYQNTLKFSHAEFNSSTSTSSHQSYASYSIPQSSIDTIYLWFSNEFITLTTTCLHWLLHRLIVFRIRNRFHK